MPDFHRVLAHHCFFTIVYFPNSNVDRERYDIRTAPPVQRPFFVGTQVWPMKVRLRFTVMERKSRTLLMSEIRASFVKLGRNIRYRGEVKVYF